MSDLKSAIEASLRATARQGGWHTPLLPALDGVDAERAAWRPAEGRNSIHMIVHHLNLWKGAVLADLAGEAPDLRALTAADWGEQPADPERWAAEVAEAERQVAHFEEAAAEDLSTPLPNFGTPLGQTLLFVANHDAYHTGQIMTLRRMQGL